MKFVSSIRFRWLYYLNSFALGLILVQSIDAAQTLSHLVGYTDTRSTTLWFQSDSPGKVELSYSPAAQKKPTPSVLSGQTKAESDNIVRFTLSALTPDTQYAYHVKFNSKPWKSNVKLSFTTQPLWKYRTPPPDFTIATGSCAYIGDEQYDRPGKPYGGEYEIFDAIASKQPKMMIWLGDNLYLRESDYTSAAGIRLRYKITRATPSLEKLFRTTSNLAIWDDHDFGPNDSNFSYNLKGESLAAFQAYWANPSYGLPETPGVFTQVTYGDAEFFLLDDRYYRSPNNFPNGPDKTMFGKPQLEWLKSALLSSGAVFKIIASGNQFLNDFSSDETLSIFPNDRNLLISWIHDQKIPGVVLLSGDRHFTMLMKMEKDLDYPLYDFTTSPLTSGPYSDPSKTETEAPMVVKGTVTTVRNFALLKFQGKPTERQLTMETYNSKGELQWKHEILASELAPKK